jgi:transcriptional regulator with XRE-family HTH domain
MDIRRGLARSLRLTRKARNLSQDDLSEASGRTYVGELERGQKAATLEKIDALAKAMDTHPLTVLAIAYLPGLREQDLHALQARINHEAKEILAMADKLRPRKTKRR